ncbi:chemotaxis response regulator protein-glutamate methylesterase [Magnetospirillum sp. UT-4]|uniref:protein-glutamate methylesterase/protein-glutamine glutaminase n=1 Tax=Magnetospirillum sp. UT-4 TaxID=2681467 RepID=UPI001383CF86|nr:chemotaxis response regulator protein-glutamate methylesterase [Magnetospirillum sp. UT-4]CAA7625224.1 fused chemotaxis regulator; protein-glutamate methylesterase in two-component regulatory system with CheA [Magnetospirillum sp. UT-4]
MQGSKIRVIVVDDSALMRQMLTTILSSDPGIEVVGTAPDPLVAREKIKALNPDVLTLDVEMPRMDGLAFLEKLMTLRPMPVVMVSSLTERGAEVTMKALELGAVDVFCKPSDIAEGGLMAHGRELIDKVKSAALARVRPLGDRPASAAPRLSVTTIYKSTDRLVAIGSSTGGVEALRDIILALPADSPPIVVTQHIPPKFSASFAQRLDGLAAVRVKEAAEGERLVAGHVFIAPGDRHLAVRRSGAQLITHVYDGPLVTGHKPSVNVLFHSVAEACGAKAVGVILTGMGRDGAEGLLAMRQAGAATIGEDEGSCVVYGMPKAAYELGAVERELPLSRIADEVLRLCRADGARG